MDWQHESEVVAAGVRLDDRLGRTVPFNRTEDGGITGVARLCEFEFFEEFSDATVSVLLGEEPKLLQVNFPDLMQVLFAVVLPGQRLRRASASVSRH